MPASRHPTVGAVSWSTCVRGGGGDRGEHGGDDEADGERGAPVDGHRGTHDAALAALVARTIHVDERVRGRVVADGAGRFSKGATVVHRGKIGGATRGAGWSAARLAPAHYDASTVASRFSRGTMALEF
jgi:hypothetical protein